MGGFRQKLCLRGVCVILRARVRRGFYMACDAGYLPYMTRKTTSEAAAAEFKKVWMSIFGK